MRTTGWLLASASALCVGVWLVVSGWAQPRPSVSQAVRHLRRPTELASTGGDLSSIKRGYMPPEFDRVAFALEKHTLSDPVETKYGYHLIEVLDKQPAGVIPYEEVKDFIGKYLKMQAAPKKQDSVIRSLRAQAMVEILEQE